MGTVDLSAFSATRILGTIPLLSLLADVMPFDPAAAGTLPTREQLDDRDFVVNPPRLAARREPPGAAVPDLVETRFVWKPPLRSQAVLPLLTSTSRTPTCSWMSPPGRCAAVRPAASCSAGCGVRG